MLKAQVDPGVPCLHTQDFQPCMAPGCTVEGKDFIQTQTNGKRKRKREKKSNSCRSVGCRQNKLDIKLNRHLLIWTLRTLSLCQGRFAVQHRKIPQTCH